MKFLAGVVGCIIQDRGHVKARGTWPSGRVSDDICEAHMKNFRDRVRALADQKSAKAHPLWFLGKSRR